MPTASKLVAALALGLAAYGVAGVAEYRFDLLQATGIDPRWIAFVAALVGWVQLGPMAVRGYVPAVSGGVAAAFVAFGVVSVTAACLHVVGAVQYHAYKDLNALLDGFLYKAMQNALYISDGPTLVATVFGGALAGVFAGFAGRLWA